MSDLPDHAQLTRRLVDELGYPPQGAELVAQRIEGLVGPLHDAFVSWWHDGTLPNVDINGHTANQLMRDRGLTPLATLLTLDWLRREPDDARTSLQAGHDHAS